MSLQEFKASLSRASPPAGMPVLATALWYDAKGEWEMAHTLAQEINSRTGSWVHGYLHRKEGDESNARYWYARAGRTFARIPLSAEWEEMVIPCLTSK